MTEFESHSCKLLMTTLEQFHHDLVSIKRTVDINGAVYCVLTLFPARKSLLVNVKCAAENNTTLLLNSRTTTTTRREHSARQQNQGTLYIYRYWLLPAHIHTHPPVTSVPSTYNKQYLPTN